MVTLLLHLMISTTNSVTTVRPTEKAPITLSLRSLTHSLRSTCLYYLTITNPIFLIQIIVSLHQLIQYQPLHSTHPFWKEQKITYFTLVLQLLQQYYILETQKKKYKRIKSFDLNSLSTTNAIASTSICNLKEKEVLQRTKVYFHYFLPLLISRQSGPLYFLFRSHQVELQKSFQETPKGYLTILQVALRDKIRHTVNPLSTMVTKTHTTTSILLSLSTSCSKQKQQEISHLPIFPSCSAVGPCVTRQALRCRRHLTKPFPPHIETKFIPLLPIQLLHPTYVTETSLGEEGASTATQVVEYRQLPLLTQDHFQDRIQYQNSTTSMILTHMTD